MLNRFSRYAIILIIVVAAEVHLPQFYWKILGKRLPVARIYYSPITDDFVGLHSSEDGVIYADRAGNQMDRRDFEILLPFYNYRDLDAWGVLPDSVKGIPMDHTYLRLSTQNFRFAPFDLNSPMLDLYPLLESKSDYTRLEMPAELFRIKDRMEFITAATNTINDSLTQLFTRTLQDSGFIFPAREIAGLPSTRKPFDEGYFIIDATHHVFHLKKEQGQPVLRRTPIATDVGIRKMFIAENVRREFYGFLVTWSNQIFLISYDNYHLIPLPLEQYNPNQMRLYFLADPLYRTMQYQNGDTLYCTVTNPNYQIIDTYKEPMLTRSKTKAGQIEKLLFPFVLSTDRSNTTYVHLDFNWNGWRALPGILFMLLLTVVIRRIRREELTGNWLDYIIVGVTGIFGLLGVGLIKPEPWD
jgi:hypothetical protein